MNVFNEMLASYETGNDNDRLNAVHEVMQQVALGGLYNGGFFNKAAFYGGTCLRIFHGLDRFSEDMDQQADGGGKGSVYPPFKQEFF